MSIKARLLVSISIAVAVAFILIGAATVTITRDRMVERVDETLVAASMRPPRLGDGNDHRPFGSGKRATAAIVLTSDGDVLFTEPSGFDDDPDPLPDIQPEDIAGRTGNIFTAGAVDDSGERFRVLIRPAEGNLYLATAAPLADVDNTIQSLIAVIAITGIVVLIGLILVVWVTIRRGLRPIDSMIATAGLIGRGDLSQRVENQETATEVGQLSHALNEMLTQIEASFAAKEASERRLRQFVADASHELRTPLTSIRGYAELFRSGAASTPEGMERVMSRIESEGARMGQLVEDLLLLARLDQGRPLQLEPVDLVELLRFAVMDAQVAEADRSISFDHPHEAWVEGDAGWLRQVIDNLLTNARVHTEPGTPVQVEITTDSENVTVTVADEGPGIDPEDAGHVFDRFYRADESRSRSSGGYGLGLAIVSSIVEAHGGHVSLHTAPGEGTAVIITLNRLDYRARSSDQSLTVTQRV